MLAAAHTTLIFHDSLAEGEHGTEGGNSGDCAVCVGEIEPESAEKSKTSVLPAFQAQQTKSPYMARKVPITTAKKAIRGPPLPSV